MTKLIAAILVGLAVYILINLQNAANPVMFTLLAVLFGVSGIAVLIWG